jgi:hypothetical protein
MTQQTWDQKCLLKAKELVETNRAVKIEQDTDETILGMISEDIDFEIENNIELEGHEDEILKELGGTSTGVEEHDKHEAARIVLGQTIFEYAKDMVKEEE